MRSVLRHHEPPQPARRWQGRLPILLLFASTGVARGATGGPSAANLVYTDSAEPGGPTHEWLDATGGDSIVLGDDDSAPVTLPFAFSFAGSSYSSATVSSNGVLYFAGTDTDGTTTDPNGACPTAAGWTGIAVFQDDLAASTVHTRTFGRYPDRTFVVSWDTLQPVGSPSAGRAQLWLLEGRNEAVIVLDDLTFGDAGHNGGASAFIGAAAAGDGLAYTCAGGVPDGTSVWMGDETSRPGRINIRTDELGAPWGGDIDFAYAGTSVAAGDVNGDGVDDALVGAKDRGYGQAYLMQRPWTAGTFDGADAVFSGKASGDAFGTTVLLDDVDGDGLADAIIGAPSNDDAGTNKGKVYAWLGGALNGSYAASTADFTANGDASDRPVAGTSLCANADVDGDGYADLLVGAPDSDLGATNAGSTYVYFGPLAAGSPTAGATLYSATASDRFGTKVAAGDLDGDGKAELIVSSPQNDGTASDAGVVYVYSGGSWSGSNEATASADCTWKDTTASDRFGSSLLAADIDGSGALDLIAGAPYGNGAASDAGYVWVLYDPGLGGCETTTASADAAVNGIAASANLGMQLAAGDIDGDGVDDLVISATNGKTDAAGGGIVYVFTTPPWGAVSADDADHVVLGESTGGAFGTGIAVAKDDDPWPTLLGTAPYANGSHTAEGALYSWAYTPDFLDDDADGFVDVGAGGNDCNDSQASAYPGGRDVSDGGTGSDNVDGDCDGWTDGVIIARADEDGFDYDLADLGYSGGGAPHTFDFESYAAADLLGDYVGDKATLSFSRAVYASDDVFGTFPDGNIGASFAPDVYTGITMSSTSPIEAMSFSLLDPNDTFTLTATGSDGTITFNFADSANDRTGGSYHGFSFAFPVDSVTLTPAGGDGFGLDDIAILYATETDHDGDGYTEDSGDCDDNRADVNPSQPELMGDGIDNDCDGVIDGGEAVAYTDEATWFAASGIAVEQKIDFERLSATDSLTTQYVDLGAQWDAGALGARDIDGTPPIDTIAASDDGGTLVTYFEVQQPAVGFYLLNGSGTFTVEAYLHGVLSYTTAITPSTDDQFVGIDYDYEVDEIHIVPPTAGDGTPDLYGIDNLVYSALSLDDKDGDGQTAAEGDCNDSDPTVYTGATDTPYDGVDSNCSSWDTNTSNDNDYDADGDGYASSAYGGTDCNDSNAAVNPDATETYYDRVDQNCDGQNDYDSDGDGYVSQAWGGTDCNDSSSAVSPDATETYYDGVDQNCDGQNDYDSDGDGYVSAAYGGTDCNDGSATTNPDATEIPYDGIDENCSGGSVIDDYDADGDGYVSAAYGGTDCRDDVASAYPHAPGEICYDGIDTDCDGASDYDCDGDGYDSIDYGGTDCDDSDDTINPGATDIMGDGIDSNCDDAPDYDFDGDGFDDMADGGTDCDDTNPDIYPGAVDDCYDGIDADCAGDDDFDCDKDGDDSDLYGGGDCADDNPEISSLMEDFPYDGVDMNCDGLDDYDADGDGHDSIWYGGDDCNDDDATIHPGAVDACYDGIDSDCDSTFSDDDCDHDGYAILTASDAPDDPTKDCDDTDATVHPGATEIAGDGIDQDCSGADLCSDCDGDGHVDVAYGGDDPDDTDPNVYPGAPGSDSGVDSGETDSARSDTAAAGDTARSDTARSDTARDSGGGDADTDTDSDTDTDADADTDTDSDTATDTDTSANADSGDWLPDSGYDTGPYLTNVTVTPTGTCGCASGGDSAGFAGLLLALAITRKHRS